MNHSVTYAHKIIHGGSVIQFKSRQQLCNPTNGALSSSFSPTTIRMLLCTLLEICALYGCLQKMYVASPYTDPVIAPDSNPQPLDAGDGLIWVVGPVLAVVFIICIVIAILLYKK